MNNCDGGGVDRSTGASVVKPKDEETEGVYRRRGSWQKIVVKVSMTGNKKTRKAMQIAVSIYGIDSVELTTLLRKKVGYTELLSVGPVEQKKPDAKPAEVKVQVDPYQYYYQSYGVPLCVLEL
ncbi:hypothetical protein L1987_78336 [Smallanthus sonchifolius]|uniref:Uncharacterized protein n=1 Tax=Smallanthus sonchifolius TaxID=185202 RepID=A0ACB8ZDG2_9ASTR|nr:hypothetical protein L1987_78336 [Smallanthus sonchifolius]